MLFFIKKSSFFLLFPMFAYADTLPSAITGPLNKFRNILNLGIGLLIAIAFVTFLYGVYKYISSVSVDRKEDGRTLIIYGLVGLFVMLSAWGLVTVLTGSFGLTTSPPPYNTLPKIQ